MLEVEFLTSILQVIMPEGGNMPIKNADNSDPAVFSQEVFLSLYGKCPSLAQRPVPTEHLAGSSAAQTTLQDAGLSLERSGVMAETTAFVSQGVKASVVLAPLRQNDV
ncbi:hypothetical protein BTVI_103836 [Pitangus sulphuratus]|nr:hypothetical protein BTVI_103836 [Pitangus sulphuratus]